MTYYRDSKTANHANARVFKVTWNKKPWKIQVEKHTHSQGQPAQQDRRERPLCKPDPGGAQLHTRSRKKERPEALFIPAEVAKQTALLPRQLLMESSHLAAVNLLSLKEEICQNRHYSRKLSIPGNWVRLSSKKWERHQSEHRALHVVGTDCWLLNPGIWAHNGAAARCWVIGCNGDPKWLCSCNYSLPLVTFLFSTVMTLYLYTSQYCSGEEWHI